MGFPGDSWESLDCKEIKPVNPKGSQSWIFIGGTDAEAEIPVFWPRDTKNWLIEKDPDAGKDWRQEVMGTIGWLASPTCWTWVWTSLEIWWWTGKTDVLQSMWLQRAGHDWETELNWQKSNYCSTRSVSFRTDYLF